MNRCENESGVKYDTELLGLNNGKDRFTVSKNGEERGEVSVRGRKQSLGFLMFLRHRCRDFELAIK